MSFLELNFRQLYGVLEEGKAYRTGRVIFWELELSLIFYFCYRNLGNHSILCVLLLPVAVKAEGRWSVSLCSDRPTTLFP